MKMMKSRNVVLGCLMLFLAGGILGGCDKTVYYVSTDYGDDDNYTGLDGDHPFKTIQRAIDAAQGTESVPVVIRVAAGTYDENLVLDAWESLEGGWYNTFTQRWNFKKDGIVPADGFETIIQAGADGYSCINLDIGNAESVIDGTTLTETEGHGHSGVRILNARSTVKNCIFKNLRYEGITNGSSYQIIIKNCLFSSINGWGGIYNTANANTIIENCNFTDNHTDGGIYIKSSYLTTITNCVFSGNRGEYLGGAISIQGNSEATITDCIFSGN